jgi:hypothetical protein
MTGWTITLDLEALTPDTAEAEKRARGVITRHVIEGLAKTGWQPVRVSVRRSWPIVAPWEREVAS